MMKRKLYMHLLSDAIFGSGMTGFGGTDIDVQTDEYGFPYFKAGTMKGILRETLEQYLSWTNPSGQETDREQPGREVEELLGAEGDRDSDRKIVFSDFALSPAVKAAVLEEIGDDPVKVTESLTHIRTFTALNENGMVKPGSLRNARCINKGLWFESSISFREEDKALLEELLSLVKWVGTMRNRGFGKVEITMKEAN